MHGNRDKNGWRIPREGTKSRRIYMMLKAGLDRQSISRITKTPPNTIGVLTWKIKNPSSANEMQNQANAKAKSPQSD